MTKKALTDEEAELIEAIRNYKRSRHNPSLQLYEYIIDLVHQQLDN